MRRWASLRRTGDFARTSRRGRRSVSDVLTVYALAARPGSPARVGITVSKAIGNAVVRNRVRRRVRAALDGLDLPAALDVVLIARPPIVERSTQALADTIAAALAS